MSPQIRSTLDSGFNTVFYILNFTQDKDRLFLS